MHAGDRGPRADRHPDPAGRAIRGWPVWWRVAAAVSLLGGLHRPILAVPGIPVTPDRHDGRVTAVLFSTAARLLADEARRRGLVVPSFRCPPRSDGVVRSIRRLPDGRAVVAVRVRGRSHADVVADMVEG